MKNMKAMLRASLLIISAIVCITPIFLTLTGSLASPEEAKRAYTDHLLISPEQVTVNQYLKLFFGCRYLECFYDSLRMSLIIAAGNTVLCFFAAYVFARVRFPGRGFAFFLILLGMLMPYQVSLLPNYLTVRALGLFDTVWSLILPNLFLPFGVFLLRQFILRIDQEQYAAFRLESGSTLRMLVGLVLPQVLPAVTATFVLTFSRAWSMVDQPLALIRNTGLMPLSVMLNEEFGAESGLLFAASAFSMMPILILYLFFSDRLIGENWEFMGVQ